VVVTGGIGFACPRCSDEPIVPVTPQAVRDKATYAKEIATRLGVEGGQIEVIGDHLLREEHLKGIYSRAGTMTNGIMPVVRLRASGLGLIAEILQIFFVSFQMSCKYLIAERGGGWSLMQAFSNVRYPVLRMKV
jgi:hypothetical protein